MSTVVQVEGKLGKSIFYQSSRNLSHIIYNSILLKQILLDWFLYTIHHFVLYFSLQAWSSQWVNFQISQGVNFLPLHFDQMVYFKFSL